jgi:hypothetical protein
LLAVHILIIFFGIIFKNNLEIETGIMYYPYPCLISRVIDSLKLKPPLFAGESNAYHAFSLPIHIGYKFKLANRLYANIYSGLNFDFYFCPKNNYFYPDIDTNFWSPQLPGINERYWSRNTLKQQFNILFLNRVSLQYFTKFNMGISVYASYYSGLFSVWESHLYYSYDKGTTANKTACLSRGSFWNFGIELGFKLDKNRAKNKDARKETVIKKVVKQ